MSRTLPEILLVEDNPLDVIVIKKALKEAGISFQLHIVEDGNQALDFLFKNCNLRGLKPLCPSLIILDLNLPKNTGKEVLAGIRKNPITSPIPVIILSASGEQKDIDECYLQSANCYIQKPTSISDFTRAVQMIGKIFIGTAKLPIIE